ncbi:DNA replication/repair protein RecF [Breoghania sp. L-A4]|uniref:DNA replication/repair protein RecF n=1 Tax=Breoghania sp. L-A4 TaxID=2304600 RepID=UPI000E35FE91|nr:DNA replication/repair protein RecF [Breoghania sp. L-A4]AXS38980.1 DNA replication/repair protein RecF [Breoghania sp. L-A4]
MATPAPVALSRLQLTDFRNYRAASLDFDARLIAFVGDNGAGKTNLLEAISLLSAGRGLRRAQLSELTRRDASGGWSVSAVLQGMDGETRIGTGLAPGGGRKVRINGADARSSESLLEYLRVLWLVPSMDGLFTGPAGDRRRFLDRLVLAVDPGHGRRVGDFEKALRGRNRLLENGGSGPYLDAVEAQIAALGVAVGVARRETVSLLRDLVGTRADDSDPFPRAAITLEGAFETLADSAAATDLEDRYRALLAQGRTRDRAAGRTLEGPHRSDPVVIHTAKAMPAGQASTGEQKALLIGLVLAHAELTARIARMTPVLLLDEVAAHLDPRRRQALFARLSALGLQVFMTGTDALLFADLPRDAQRFTVTEATIAVDTPPQ